MSNNYSWLGEKKKEAMMQKLQQRGMPNYRQLTPQDKYGVSFTGYGQNGQLDRNAPAGVEANGAVFHEGELRADIPEGQMYANAGVTQMMMNPRTIQERGFAAGGFNPIEVPRLGQETTVVPRLGQETTEIPRLGQGTTEVQRLGQGTTGLGSTTIPTTAGTVRQITADEQPATQTLGIPNQVTPVKQISTDTGLAAQRPVRQIEAPAEITPIKPMGEVQTIPTGGTTGTTGIVRQVTTDQQPATAQTIPTGGTTDKPVVPAEKTAEDIAREKGINWLLDVLNKENPALLLEGRRAASELSLRQQQERSQSEQELLQQGVDPGRARLEGQMLRDKQESELNDLASQYGIAGMKARQEIAGTLATEGLQGQQFEELRNNNKDNADWKAYEAAIAAGDFDTAAKAYQTVTGKPISMDQMKTFQTYMNTKNTQDIATGDVTIKRLQNDLGNDIAASVQDRINSGRSLEQINAEFPNAKLTMAEFQNMYDATPTGNKTFERNLGFANTLLQAEDGKGTNTAAAVKILDELFPGTGIDFSGVVTTAKAATFNQGMGMLSDYVTAGMDWKEAIVAIEKNGTLDMLGLDKPATEKLYRSLKVNAIDEQLKAITDSTLLTDEEKADAKVFATAVLTGQLDYKIQKEYTVTKDGQTTTMYMDSSAAATYATSNPGSSIVGTGKSKVVPITDILDDEDGTTDTTPTKRTEPLGTVIVEKGKIYQVIADGKTQEITPDVDDPWSDNNSKIIKAGETNNQYYKTIFDQRYKSITNDGKLLSDIKKATAVELGVGDLTINSTAALYNGEFEEYRTTLGFDDPVIQKLKSDMESQGLKITIVKDGNSWKFAKKE